MTKQFINHVFPIPGVSWVTCQPLISECETSLFPPASELKLSGSQEQHSLEEEIAAVACPSEKHMSIFVSGSCQRISPTQSQN